MSYQVVKEPSGRLAIWSTTVDDFIYLNCSREDVIEFFLRQERRRIEPIVDAALAGDVPPGGSSYEELILIGAMLRRARDAG